MTRTADHVLFGRADLAGDATDSAHRPPMVERGGPRPDRGGSPLPPTSVAVLLDPCEPGRGQLAGPRDPRRLFPLPRPRRVHHPPAEAPDDSVRHHRPQNNPRRRGPEPEYSDDSLHPATAGRYETDSRA